MTNSQIIELRRRLDELEQQLRQKPFELSPAADSDYLDYYWDAATSEHVFSLNDNATWNYGFILSTKTEIRIPGATVAYVPIGLHCDSHQYDSIGGNSYKDEWALVASVGDVVHTLPNGWPTGAPWYWTLGPNNSLTYIPLAYVNITGAGEANVEFLSTITPAMLAAYAFTRPYCGIKWKRAADGSSLIVEHDQGKGVGIPIDTSGWAVIEDSIQWTITTAQVSYQLKLWLDVEVYLGNNFTQLTANGTGQEAFVMGIIDVDADLRISIQWTRPLGTMVPSARGLSEVYFTPTLGLPAQYTSRGILVPPPV